jgi:hypothetical protein
LEAEGERGAFIPSAELGGILANFYKTGEGLLREFVAS